MVALGRCVQKSAKFTGTNIEKIALKIELRRGLLGASTNSLNTELQQNVNKDVCPRSVQQFAFRILEREQNAKPFGNSRFQSIRSLESSEKCLESAEIPRTISSGFLYWFFSLNLVEMVTSTSEMDVTWSKRNPSNERDY